MKILLGLFFLIYFAPLNAQTVFFGYSTKIECVNKELQKYPNPNKYSFSVVDAYCTEHIDKKNEQLLKEVMNKISKNCNLRFDYSESLKAGYSYTEIINFFKSEYPQCL